jgi:hypothetical protein
MKQHLRATLWLLQVAVATAASVLAQDLEVFELETLIDPAILEVDGKDEKLFYTFQLRSGLIQDFQSRTQFVRDDFAFVDLTSSIVYKKYQGTVRATGFENSDEHAHRRLEVQFGRYFAPSTLAQERVLDENPEEPAVLISRVQVSFSREWDSQDFARDTIGLDIHTGEVTLGNVDFVGHFTYALREEGPEPESSPEHYLSLGARTVNNPIGKKASFDIGMGIGGEHVGGKSRFGSLRLELRVAHKLGFQEGKIYAVYAPAYQIGNRDGSSRPNHELALYLHFPIFSKIFG